MSPMMCIERLKSVETTLGAEKFNEFKDQMDKVALSVDCIDIRDIEYLFRISAAHVAGIYLRQMQHSYPHHAMSGWSLQHQMEAVYAFLACELDFQLDTITANSASDLEIKHAVAEFESYPIAEVK